jgi:hypothetical protein
MTDTPTATRTAKGIRIAIPGEAAYEIKGASRLAAEAVTFSFFRAADFPERGYTVDWWVPVVNKTRASAGKPYTGMAARVVVVELD